MINDNRPSLFDFENDPSSGGDSPKSKNNRKKGKEEAAKKPFEQRDERKRQKEGDNSSPKMPSKADLTGIKKSYQPAFELPRQNNEHKESVSSKSESGVSSRQKAGLYFEQTQQKETEKDVTDNKVNLIKEHNESYKRQVITFEQNPRVEEKKNGLSKETEAIEQKSSSPASPKDDSKEKENKNQHIGLPQWDLDKNYYTIGEVAGFFGVKVSHIRFWTKEFKIKNRTTRKGDRLFTPKQIKTLRLIHHLVKERKHTLEGVKEILKSGEAAVEQKLNLRTELEKLHHLLTDMKANLVTE